MSGGPCRNKYGYFNEDTGEKYGTTFVPDSNGND